eukprot:PhM_4_TR15430/c1_g1_i1/m.22456
MMNSCTPPSPRTPTQQQLALELQQQYTPRFTLTPASAASPTTPGPIPAAAMLHSYSESCKRGKRQAITTNRGTRGSSTSPTDAACEGVSLSYKKSIFLSSIPGAFLQDVRVVGTHRAAQLSSRAMEIVSQALRTHDIGELHFESCDVADADVYELATALAGNRSVRVLSFRSSVLWPSFISILSCVTQHPVLHRVTLSDVLLDDISTQRCADTLAHVLKKFRGSFHESSRHTRSIDFVRCKGIPDELGFYNQVVQATAINHIAVNVTPSEADHPATARSSPSPPRVLYNGDNEDSEEQIRAERQRQLLLQSQRSPARLAKGCEVRLLSLMSSNSTATVVETTQRGPISVEGFLPIGQRYALELRNLSETVPLFARVSIDNVPLRHKYHVKPNTHHIVKGRRDGTTVQPFCFTGKDIRIEVNFFETGEPQQTHKDNDDDAKGPDVKPDHATKEVFVCCRLIAVMDERHAVVTEKSGPPPPGGSPLAMAAAHAWRHQQRSKTQPQPHATHGAISSECARIHAMNVLRSVTPTRKSNNNNENKNNNHNNENVSGVGIVQQPRPMATLPTSAISFPVAASRASLQQRQMDLQQRIAVLRQK